LIDVVVSYTEIVEYSFCFSVSNIGDNAVVVAAVTIAPGPEVLVRVFIATTAPESNNGIGSARTTLETIVAVVVAVVVCRRSTHVKGGLQLPVEEGSPSSHLVAVADCLSLCRSSLLYWYCTALSYRVVVVVIIC
jgi:hypothetical protein